MNRQAIEQEIQDKGLTAPRVTLEDIEANIVGEYYFTGGQATSGPSMDQVAHIAHEVNRAYCQALGDDSQLGYADAPEWQRASARMGVDLHTMGNFGPRGQPYQLDEAEARRRLAVRPGERHGEERASVHRSV